MYYIGIDVGEKNNGIVAMQEDEIFYHNNLRPDDLFKRVNKLLNKLSLNDYVFIVESFKIYAWMVNTFSFSTMKTIEVIGVLKYLIPESCLVMQSPSVRKFFEDKVEKGMFKDKHIRDAYIHILYYKKFGKQNGK